MDTGGLTGGVHVAAVMVFDVFGGFSVIALSFLEYNFGVEWVRGGKGLDRFHQRSRYDAYGVVSQLSSNCRDRDG